MFEWLSICFNGSLEDGANCLPDNRSILIIRIVRVCSFVYCCCNPTYFHDYVVLQFCRHGLYLCNLFSWTMELQPIYKCKICQNGGDLQGVPKKRSRFEKVHSFVNKTDISKIFYTVVVLLYVIHNMTSNLLADNSLASDVITNL